MQDKSSVRSMRSKLSCKGETQVIDDFSEYSKFNQKLS